MSFILISGPIPPFDRRLLLSGLYTGEKYVRTVPHKKDMDSEIEQASVGRPSDQGTFGSCVLH